MKKYIVTNKQALKEHKKTKANSSCKTSITLVYDCLILVELKKNYPKKSLKNICNFILHITGRGYSALKKRIYRLRKIML
jgi:dsDNA-specific endonuclease/ATPase MutS2